MFEQLAVFERSVLIGYQDEEGNETPGLIPMIIYGREKASQSGFGSEKEAHGYVNKMWSVFFKPLINGCDTTSNDKACVQYRAVISGDAPISSLANYTKYFDRTAIVPFIVGMVLVYYFVVAVFEVVKRIFKLLVLQIVYPIPLNQL